jgi:hypothetical protein
LLEAFVLAIELVGREAGASFETVPDIDNIAVWWESSLLASVWWYRVWTIQEYVLAQSCHFQIGLCRISEGIMTMSWEIFNCISRTSYSASNQEVIRSLDPQNHIRLSTGLLPHERLWTLPQHLRLHHRKNPKFFDILFQAYCHSMYKVGCSDTRDKVFGLSSLAEADYKSLGIQTDYRKLLRQIYIDVAHRLIISGELDILSLCRGQDSPHLKELSTSLSLSHNQPNLPSWAVDWTIEINKPHSWFVDIRNSLFSASGKTSTSASFQNYDTLGKTQSPCSMILAGILVDEVSQVGRMECGHEAYGMGMHVSISREVQAMCKISQGVGHDIYTASQLQEAVWRIPVWDHEMAPDTSWRRATRLSKARHNACLHYGLAEEINKKMKDLNAEKGKHGVLRSIWHQMLYVVYSHRRRFHWASYLPCSESLIDRVVYWSYTRLHPLLFQWDWFASFYDRLLKETAATVAPYSVTTQTERPHHLIVTQRGYIGMAPITTRPGDVVYILFGSRVPHILRKRENGQSGYTLVGDAFVYGAMNGELMRDDMSRVDVEIF